MNVKIIKGKIWKTWTASKVPKKKTRSGENLTHDAISPKVILKKKRKEKEKILCLNITLVRANVTYSNSTCAKVLKYLILN